MTGAQLATGGRPVARRRRPGLEGASKGLAVVFWTALLVSLIVLSAVLAVTASSQFLSGLCGDGCDAGYVIDPRLTRVAIFGLPLLGFFAIVAWGVVRWGSRAFGNGIFTVVLIGQLGFLGWVCWTAYDLFVAR